MIIILSIVTASLHFSMITISAEMEKKGRRGIVLEIEKDLVISGEYKWE